MRATFVSLAALVATAAAATNATFYPYGYWDVNITTAELNDTWSKNLTVKFFDDNKEVTDEGKEFHCESRWIYATQTEVKHCDSTWLVASIGQLGRHDVDLTQTVSWGSGKFVSSYTVWGSETLSLNCATGSDTDCNGFVRVNASNYGF